MKVQRQTCSRDTIEQFLADQLDSAELLAFEDHLGSCECCRDYLEGADDGSWWQEARSYLASSGLGSSLKDEQQPTRIDEVGPSNLGALAALKGYLGPTDDPRMLGRLGGYEILGVIGWGGMGIVLKGFDPALNRCVAVKMLSPSLALSASARQRFGREARVAAAVVHDNVVAIHSVAEANGLPYFVMPYLPGPSLEKRLRENGAFRVVEVLRIGRQIASGLAAAHAQGLVHRDVKPANILLGEGVERVTLTDFGLACAVDDASLTQSGMIAGTPQYMSPEQAAGGPVDYRSDLFSLGSVLYALCAGRPPFRASTTVGVLKRVVEETPRPIRDVNPEVPDFLAALIDQLQAKAPAERLQSAAEVAALLESYLAHLGQPATVPAPVLPPRPAGGQDHAVLPLQIATGQRWRLLRWPAAMLVLLIGLAVGRWLLAQNAAEPRPAAQMEFYQDFRGGRPRHPAVLPTGDQASAAIEQDNEGVRIKLSGVRKMDWPVGFAVVSTVKGNCEITAGYEILQADQPKTGNGVGFEVYLATPTATKDAISFLRAKCVDGTEVYRRTHLTTTEGKRRSKTDADPVAAKDAAVPVSRSGRLRVTRQGKEVTYSVAEGNADTFRELWHVPFGSEDLNMVRVVAFPGSTTEEVEVRLLDLKVRAESIVPDPRMQLAVAVQGGRAAISKGWLVTAQVIGLAITLALLGLGAWLIARRRRALRSAAEAPPAARQASTAPVISFPCPGCGRNMKVKAEMAGKKGKCSQCGRAVQVPATTTTAITETSQ